MRLDIYLTEKNLVRSRSQAADLIKRGKVKVNGKIILKPSKQISSESEIIISKEVEYVSRAAEKLLKAIKIFDLNLRNKVCLDIGASTGGFTQVMLNEGAKLIFAVDVGTNQLNKKLLLDSRVVSYENTDARKLTTDLIYEKPDFFTIDVSFISIKHILENLLSLFKSETEGVILIKPQFEGSFVGNITKIPVKDPKKHIGILNGVISYIRNFFYVASLIPSPIRGKDGTIEYLGYLTQDRKKITDFSIERIVLEAEKNFTF